jgi:hypothetical protein
MVCPTVLAECKLSQADIFLPTPSERAFRFGDSVQDESRVQSVVFEYSVVNLTGPGSGPLQLMKMTAVQG